MLGAAPGSVPGPCLVGASVACVVVVLPPWLSRRRVAACSGCVKLMEFARVLRDAHITYAADGVAPSPEAFRSVSSVGDVGTLQHTVVLTDRRKAPILS